MFIFYFHELWREYSTGSLNNESGRVVVERGCGYSHDALPWIRRERTVTESSRKTVVIIGSTPQATSSSVKMWGGFWPPLNLFLMSLLGHSRPKWAFRAMSALPPVATE